MKRFIQYWPVIFSFLLLFAAGCAATPEPLPTDNVGPMLGTPAARTVRLPEERPLLLLHDCLEMDPGQFWVLDVEAEAWRIWEPATVSVRNVSGASVAWLYHEATCKPGSREINTLVVAPTGQAALTENLTYSTMLSTWPAYLSPATSPDGRWWIASGSDMVWIENLDSGAKTAVELNRGWVLDWSADNERFLYSSERAGSHITTVEGQVTKLPGSAGGKSFTGGQWLSEEELVLLAEEQLYHLDLPSGNLEELTDFGRVVWFAYSPEQSYIATLEKVECIRRWSNSSWIRKEERCVHDLFIYDGDGQNRRRFSDVNFIADYDFRPVWAP